MPVPNGKIETNNYKKQKRWSLIGILSKKKKFKKSQESVDFCPYDGKINQKVAQNNHLDRSSDCLIEQYTCSPRLIRKCNSLQYMSQVSAYSNTTSQPRLNEWKLSQQSVYSSSSSACYSDSGAYRSYEISNQPSYYIKEGNEEQTCPIVQNVPFRCSSEIGHYHNKINDNQRYSTCSVRPKKLIGKKIPPPPPPRDPNIKAVYYIRNNRLMSRESDSTYFSQGSDDSIADKDNVFENEMERRNEYCIKEPPRSRRPIQICDVETLSTESENSEPRIQTAEEAIQELEDIYNSLGLSDEDLLDRAERRDLPTYHQNMRYESYDELDCVTFKRILPKTRRSGVPDIVSDDMAYRRLHKKESKQKMFAPGSFLLVLPTVHNLDKSPRPSGEPDITLDDVVFRSRRQHLNFLKIPDPQPPFGIPLGPIVGAAPSDYLHAVPEGRYKPSFHPRKMPDTVEDDLAFRALRKDHKYKTCIDFSFVRRNRYGFDGPMMPEPGGNGAKNNDSRWIVKTERPSFAARSNGENRRVQLVLDDTDNRRNVMVVKIDHHRPIVLTAFDVDQSSESLFCCAGLLSSYDPRKTRLLTDALPARRRSDRVTAADDDGKNRAPVEFRPNFRALIRREHARGYRPWSEHANPADRIVRVVAGEIESSRLVNDGDAASSTVVAVGRYADDSTVAKEQEPREEHPSPSVTIDGGGGGDASHPAEYPGYLEVCLYITIYVYQLFSVNAYSTFIALIFLVALHVCRRLS